MTHNPSPEKAVQRCNPNFGVITSATCFPPDPTSRSTSTSYCVLAQPDSRITIAAQLLPTFDAFGTYMIALQALRPTCLCWLNSRSFALSQLALIHRDLNYGHKVQSTRRRSSRSPYVHSILSYCNHASPLLPICPVTNAEPR